MELTKGDIVDCLEYHCTSDHVPDWNIVRRYLVYRVGILLARTRKSFEFPHNVIREFLAACYLRPVQDNLGHEPQSGPPYRTWEEGVESLLLQPSDGWTAWAESFVRAAEFLYYQEEVRNSGGGDDAVWRMVQAIVAIPRRVPGSGEAPAGTNNESDIARLTYLAGELLSRLVSKGGRDGRLQDLDEVRDRHVDAIREERLDPPTRARAARNLGQIGDPRFHGPEGLYLPKDAAFPVDSVVTGGAAGRQILGFIEIPAGKFLCGPHDDLFGTKYEGVRPVHLDTYWMARFPVTNAQYALFLKHGAEILGSAYEAFGGPPLVGTATDAYAPVEVRWSDARTYARWLEAILSASEPPGWLDPSVLDDLAPIREGIRNGCLRITLPTEEEWEKAARGPSGGEWPWSNRLEDGDPARLSNIYETGIGKASSVGCFPSGRSPYGIEEVSGSVWEWTRSLWGEEVPTPAYLPGASDAACREGAPLRHDEMAARSWRRVVRGGSFRYDQWYARCGFRVGPRPGFRDVGFGFRLVASPFLGSGL
ncbi:MAG: formylglycine-generating enzyme family protein [Candidatus Eisenbacteria bacterium]